jgi:hypothetical protein
MRGNSSLAALLGPLAPQIPVSQGLEVKRWTYFDDTTILAAASPIAGDLAFFQTPVGTGGKTRFNTNFHGNGQLSADNFFEIQAIGVEVVLTLLMSETTLTILNGAADFFYRVLTQGVFSLMTGGSKLEIDNIPLTKFGAGAGFSGLAGGGANITAAGAAGGGYVLPNNGAPVESAMYDLGSQPVTLYPNRSFVPTLSFPAAGVAIPANNGARFKVYLEGYLHRPA